MSTILDALRKLEEERRSRTTDVRSRLLLSSAHQTQPLRWQKPSWRTNTSLISILSFALAGFAAGAGVVLWRSYSGPPQPEQISVSSATKDDHERPVIAITNTQPPAASPAIASTHPNPQDTQPSPQTQVTTHPPPREPTRTDTAIAEEDESQLSPSPAKNEDTTLVTASAVQRSPFIASPSSTTRDATPRSSAALAAQTPPTQQKDALALQTTLRNRRAAAVAPPPPPSTYQQPTVGEAPAVASAGTSLSFLQWSSDPDRRIAFLRVNGGPLTMAHEGDTIGGYTVVEIRQTSVELQSGEGRTTLQAR
jgi:hypothetical protein